MTFEDYVQVSESACQINTAWRRGQAYFNVLYRHRPDLSEQIRGGQLDPFHRDDRVNEFLTWVESNWTL